MRLRAAPALASLFAFWLGCATATSPGAQGTGRAAGPAAEAVVAQGRDSAGSRAAKGGTLEAAAPGVTGGPPGSCAGLTEGPLVHLTVLATNDVHGALESKTYPWSQAGRPVGGAATLAAFIERERAANPQGTLLLDGGDLMQGTAISNLTQGESAIEYFNAAGYDAAAIGNHEFDWGIGILALRMAQARFPFLSANIVGKADGERPPWATPTATLRRKGLAIGVIGLTTQGTPATTLPEHVANLQFGDLADAVRAEAARLQGAGTDLLVVLAHAGGTYDPASRVFSGEIVDAMRRMPPSVDLVVSGHTHTLLEGVVNGIPLVQARSRGTALGVVQLWVDPDDDRVICSEIRVETTYGDLVRPDSAMTALVARYAAEIDPVTERVVAEAAHRLTTNRYRESVLGDLIADAQRAATGSQIALTNSGGIRSEIDAGPIRWREAFEAQPFWNPLHRLRITGRTLLEALEQGVSGEFGLVQVSGLRFTVDPRAPTGRRVADLRLESGVPVQPDSTYTVTVNNFMAQGGDGYSMLQNAPSDEDTGIIDLDAFVDHLQRLPQPIRYAVQGRIRFLGDTRGARDAR